MPGASTTSGTFEGGVGAKLERGGWSLELGPLELGPLGIGLPGIGFPVQGGPAGMAMTRCASFPMVARLPMRKLLLLDDSTGLRRLWTRLLRDAGVVLEELIEANDAAAALQALERDATIDVVLADAVAAESCLEGLTKPRQGASTPLIVVYASEGASEASQRAREAGVAVVLEKPYRAEHLRQALEEGLNRAA